MEIEIKCFATLSSFTPKDGRLEVADGATVQAVAEQLGVPLADVKLIFINGIRAELDSPVQAGDRLGIFPPVGGG